MIDVDLGPRDDDTREASEFFKKITEVREALRVRRPTRRDALRGSGETARRHGCGSPTAMTRQ